MSLNSLGNLKSHKFSGITYKSQRFKLNCFVSEWNLTTSQTLSITFAPLVFISFSVLIAVNFSLISTEKAVIIPHDAPVKVMEHVANRTKK